MFITTKAEFIWDGEQYVEVHTEGYDYEGELDLAITDDTSTGSTPATVEGYIAAHTAGVDFTGGGNYQPKLWDLINLNVNDVLKLMGYSSMDIGKYGYMVPEYDPYEENIARDEYNLTMEAIGNKEDAYRQKIQDSTGMYQLAQEERSSSLYDIAQAGEMKGYEAFGQESAVASGGLGMSNRRARTAMIRASESESDKVRMSSLSDKSQYESAIESVERDISSLETERGSSLLDLEKAVGRAERNYETEFWDFVSFLDENNVRPNDNV